MKKKIKNYYDYIATASAREGEKFFFYTRDIQIIEKL